MKNTNTTINTIKAKIALLEVINEVISLCYQFADACEPTDENDTYLIIRHNAYMTVIKALEKLV